MAGVPGGNVWAWRVADGEKNWWEHVNNRKPAEHELAAICGADDDNTVVPHPAAQCICLQCGVLVPPTKTCGRCKLAAYCSRDCQRQHWQRHKPQCARLQQAEQERAAKGQPRPPAPTPDSPLQLLTNSSELVFSRDDYRALLRAHQAGRQAAAAAAGAVAAAQRACAPDQVHTAPSRDALAGGSGLDDCDDGGAQQREQGQQRDGSAGSESTSPTSSSSSLAGTSSSCSSATSTSPLLSQSPSRPASAPLKQQQQQHDVAPANPSLFFQQDSDGSTGSVSACCGSCPWPRSWPPPPSLPLMTPPRPAGILNTGNSCYAASALQALLATPGLGEYLRSGVHRGECLAADGDGLPPGVSSWCPACDLSRLAATAAATVATPPTEKAAESAGSGPAVPDVGAGPSSGAGPTPSAWGAAAAVANRVWPWSRPRPAAATAVDARGLTKNVTRLGRTLVPGRQEDAHEFWAKLLEALGEVQVATAGGSGLLRAQAARRAAARRRKAEEAVGDSSNFDGTAPAPGPPVPVWRGEESSLVHQVLGGYLRRATLCDCCGHVSQSHESVLGLEVPLGPRVSSVDAGLKGFFEDEVLGEGNEYRCERCRQLVCATRRVRLEVAPNALAVTLKRFAAGAGGWGPRMAKDTRPIALRMNLDLTPYMAPGSLDPGPATYRLYGLVQHLGILPPGATGGGPSPSGLDNGGAGPSPLAMSMSMHMGHYVAVVRGGDGAWYRCDDDEVTSVSEAEVMSITDAYLLFYERVQPFVPVPSDAGRNGSGAGALQQGEDVEQQLEQGEQELPQERQATTGEAAARGHGASAVVVQPSPLPPQQQLAGNGSVSGQAVTVKPDGAERQAALGTPVDAVAAVTTELDIPVPSTPRWSAWLAADDRPQQVVTGEAAVPAPAAGVVCPSYRLRRHRSAGNEGQTWALRIHLPGVKGQREVRVAATCPPSPPVSSVQSLAAARGLPTVGADGDWQVAGRVRVWVAGRYNVDVQLRARRWEVERAGSWQLAVVEEGHGAGGPADEAGKHEAGMAAAVGVEVLQPRWGPASCTLHVPLRLHTWL